MPFVSMNRRGTAVHGMDGTWTEVERRSGFRLMESVEYGDSVQRIVLNQEGEVVARTDGSLSDVLGSLMGPARAAHGFAVANRRPGTKRGRGGRLFSRWYR